MSGADWGRWIDRPPIALMLKYVSELDKRIRRHLKPTNNSWWVDETDIKARGVWKYLYRVVDSEGNTLDFILSAKRDDKAAG